MQSYSLYNHFSNVKIDDINRYLPTSKYTDWIGGYSMRRVDWENMNRFVGETVVFSEASHFVGHPRKAIQFGQGEEEQQMILRKDILIDALCFYRYDIDDVLEPEDLSETDAWNRNRWDRELRCSVLDPNETQKTGLLMSPESQSPPEPVLPSLQKTAQKLDGLSVRPGPR